MGNIHEIIVPIRPFDGFSFHAHQNASNSPLSSIPVLFPLSTSKWLDKTGQSCIMKLERNYYDNKF
jgi:hypothetical protein